MDYMASARDIRAKAWAELVASPAFRAFRAADNMVVEMGGESEMSSIFPIASASSPHPKAVDNLVKPPRRVNVRGADGKPRLTQVQATEKVLREYGPMGIKDIVDLARSQGAAIGGSNPIANFRSALSKDERFYAFRSKGEFLWWLTGVDLPERWDEAADDLLRNAASPVSSQEGGDNHAATIT